MKKFKQIDLWMQALITVVTVGICILTHFAHLIPCFFIIAAWQLVSIFVHEAKLWFIRSKYRRYYHITVTSLLFLVFLTSLMPEFLIVVIILPYLFVLMAVYYFVICLEEWHQLHKRPLSILK